VVAGVGSGGSGGGGGGGGVMVLRNLSGESAASKRYASVERLRRGSEGSGTVRLTAGGGPTEDLQQARERLRPRRPDTTGGVVESLVGSTKGAAASAADGALAAEPRQPLPSSPQSPTSDPLGPGVSDRVKAWKVKHATTAAGAGVVAESVEVFGGGADPASSSTSHHSLRRDDASLRRYSEPLGSIAGRRGKSPDR
jgi:hypothetical protein